MKKNMRIWPVEIDGEWIWFSDELMGGLYRYHKSSKEVKCEISPLNLYNRNVFRINGIVCWNGFIILCPFFLNCPVVVFSKKVKSMKTVFIRGMEKNVRLDGARKIGNMLYLNMYYSHIAVLIFNLDELCNSPIKEITPKEIKYPDNSLHGVWFAKCLNNVIYLPDHQKKNIYKVEGENISCIKAEVPKNIFTIYFYQSELWIIAAEGWELYRIDQNGKLLETILLKQDDPRCEESELYHIAITKDYFFLMSNNEAIGCYNRKKQCEEKLMICQKELENQYVNKLPGTFLFGIENDNRLYIPPYGNRGLEIDLQTLACKPIDIFYPNEVEEHVIDYGTEITIAHSTGRTFVELTSKSLSAYINCNISNRFLNTYDRNSRMNIGKKVYYKDD